MKVGKSWKGFFFKYLEDPKAMVADPEMWKAFIRHLEEMIERLKRELAPYQAKTQFVYRVAGGETIEITADRIKQIEREIQSLRNTLARVQEHDS